MRGVFLGTPEFAVASLNQILSLPNDFEVLEVITQPDRPKGRKQELAASPVKLSALRAGLPVYQPERIRRAESVEHLRGLNPEVMVVVGYGQIIPQSIIDIPALGIVNVHASLLPELRGAAPIQWSIARGFARTGVTIMKIDAGLDTGEMLAKRETAIGENETAPELSLRLATAGAELLTTTLRQLAAGQIAAEKQDNNFATHAPILTKEHGRIDWQRPAFEIHNLIRGLLPWPGAYTSFRGQSLHLWRSRVLGSTPAGLPVPFRNLGRDLQPGALVLDNGVFAIGGDGAALELLEVQLEGRKRMPADLFANGHRLTSTERLGA